MSASRILHLEDNAADAYLIKHWLAGGGIDADMHLAGNAETYRAALQAGDFDLILADSSVPSMSPLEALHLAQESLPDVPFVCLSGAADDHNVKIMLAAGAADYVLKDHEWRLIAVAQRELRSSQRARQQRRLAQHMHSTLTLVHAVQELSLARDVATIREVVSRAARAMAGADGATFVLRDGDYCHYVDEDAIAPLWKGQRFPLSSCISGWSMLNREPAVIPDIYQDPRIPSEAYRPTFVKSLVMVPIRQDAPIGAIGIYWASSHLASQDEVHLLQALANTTAVALENVAVYQDLDRRVKERTRQLETANSELRSFAASVSHDLRAPLRAIRGYGEILRVGGTDPAMHQQYIEHIVAGAHTMSHRIEDLLRLAQISRGEVHRQDVDLGALARATFDGLQAAEPARRVELQMGSDMQAYGDAGLLEALLDNLVSNAWKYSSPTADACIEIGSERQYDGSMAYFVRDNGVGFDMKDASRLFTPFQRLHDADDFPGEGIGLATAARIVHKHDGEIWTRATPGEGATFYFTLGDAGTVH